MGRLPLGRFPILGLTIEFILWPPAWSTAWNWVHRPRLAFWDRLFLAKWQKNGKNQNLLARPVGVQAHFGGSYGQVEYFFGRFFGRFVIFCHFCSPLKTLLSQKWLKWVIKAKMTDFAFFSTSRPNWVVRCMAKLLSRVFPTSTSSLFHICAKNELGRPFFRFQRPRGAVSEIDYFWQNVKKKLKISFFCNDVWLFRPIVLGCPGKLGIFFNTFCGF